MAKTIIRSRTKMQIIESAETLSLPLWCSPKTLVSVLSVQVLGLSLSPGCGEIHLKCCDVTIAVTPTPCPPPPRLSRLNTPHLPNPSPPLTSSVHLGLIRLTAELISPSVKSQMLADQTAAETLPRKASRKAPRTCFCLFFFNATSDSSWCWQISELIGPAPSESTMLITNSYLTNRCFIFFLKYLTFNFLLLEEKQNKHQKKTNKQKT